MPMPLSKNDPKAIGMVKLLQPHGNHQTTSGRRSATTHQRRLLPCPMSSYSPLAEPEAFDLAKAKAKAKVKTKAKADLQGQEVCHLATEPTCAALTAVAPVTAGATAKRQNELRKTVLVLPAAKRVTCRGTVPTNPRSMSLKAHLLTVRPGCLPKDLPQDGTGHVP